MDADIFTYYGLLSIYLMISDGEETEASGVFLQDFLFFIVRVNHLLVVLKAQRQFRQFRGSLGDRHYVYTRRRMFLYRNKDKKHLEQVLFFIAFPFFFFFFFPYVT
jgi:hypothetical protein